MTERLRVQANREFIWKLRSSLGHEKRITIRAPRPKQWQNKPSRVSARQRADEGPRRIPKRLEAVGLVAPTPRCWPSMEVARASSIKPPTPSTAAGSSVRRGNPSAAPRLSRHGSDLGRRGWS